MDNFSKEDVRKHLKDFHDYIREVRDPEDDSPASDEEIEAFAATDDGSGTRHGLGNDPDD